MQARETPMKTTQNKGIALITSLLVGLSVLVVPTVVVSACAGAQKNPDARPGLRRRANESQRNLDRTIETNRKSEENKP